MEAETWREWFPALAAMCFIAIMVLFRWKKQGEASGGIDVTHDGASACDGGDGGGDGGGD